MNDESAGSVLRRMIAQSSGSAQTPVGEIGPPAAQVLGNVMARVAQEDFDLILAPENVVARKASLPELMELLPETGLLALLDGPTEGQGVMALDFGLFAALVEKQTMGRLRKTPPEARRPTRVDAALTADVIDAVLADFALSDEGYVAKAFGYSTFLAEARPLALMLEETTYALFSFEVDLDRGARQGSGVLALPLTADQLSGAAPARPAAAVPEEWRDGLRENLLEAKVGLEAILYRTPMSIAEISKLKPGDTLTVPMAALNEVRIEGPGGVLVGHADLGQCDGNKALRIHPPKSKTKPTAGAFEASGAPSDLLALEDTPNSPPALDMELMGAADLPEIPDLADLSGPPSLDPIGDLPDIGDVGGLPSLDDLPSPNAELPDLGDLAPVGDLPDLGDLAPTGELPDLGDLAPAGDLPSLPDININ